MLELISSSVLITNILICIWMPQQYCINAYGMLVLPRLWLEATVSRGFSHATVVAEPGKNSRHCDYGVAD
jgi:hypothetical protein